MSQAGLVDIEASNPQIPTTFNTDSGSAVPLANVIEIVGSGNITTSGAGNTVTVSQAAADILQVTPDTGAAVTPDGSGNINAYGYQADTVQTIETHNDSGDLRIEDRTWETQYVVDPSSTVGLRGTFTTIQAAIDQAKIDGMSLANPKKIYIRQGVYTEDITFETGAQLVGESGVLVHDYGSPISSPYIFGVHTFDTSSQNIFTGITFENNTASTDLFTCTNVEIQFIDCNFNNNSSTGEMFVNTHSASRFYFRHCQFFSDTIFQNIFDFTDASQFRADTCRFNSLGFSVASIALRFNNCENIGAIVLSSANVFARYSSFTANIVDNISGTSSGGQIEWCKFTSNDATTTGVSSTGTWYFTSSSLSETSSGPNDLYGGSGTYAPTKTSVGNILIAKRVAVDTILDGSESYVGVTDTSITRTITLRGLTNDYTVYVCDESGGAGTNNITVDTVSGNINGSATYTIDSDYGAAKFIFDGTDFFITNDSKPASGTVTSVSGTANRITSTGGATPVIDIDATYVGQATITTLGTITTGTWNASTISEVYGGTNQTTYATGDILYASGANTLSKLTAGSNGEVLTLSAGIPSWAANAGGDVSGPGSSTDNAIVRWDGTSGDTIQDSSVIIDDSDVVSGATQINVDNLRLDGNTLSSTNTNGAVAILPDGTGRVSLDRSINGSNIQLSIQNNDTTGAANSGSLLKIASRPEGVGDPYINLAVIATRSYCFGIDNSDEFLKINTTSGTDVNPSSGTNVWTMTEAGERTMPLQPAFLALGAGQTNITGNGTVAGVTFTNEIYDQNSDFASSTFTSPITGRYNLNIMVGLNGLGGTVSVQSKCRLLTSNRNYNEFWGTIVTISDNFPHKLSVTADMDAADTASVDVQMTGIGADTVDVATGEFTNFSGYLAC